jgi:hypothetical protein
MLLDRDGVDKGGRVRSENRGCSNPCQCHVVI